MKILIDLNVLLDVVQKREPFYDASAAVIDLVARRDVAACVPAHALTTLHYVLSRYAGRVKADEVIDWLLAAFEVVPEGRAEFLRARSLKFDDFEDAVTASAAEAATCSVIVTRNIADFALSPIDAATPEEFLAGHEAEA